MEIGEQKNKVNATPTLTFSAQVIYYAFQS